MRRIYPWLLGACLLFCIRQADAAGPSVSDIQVSDVTPKSFTVFWITGEPSNAGLKIYKADCSTLLDGLPLEPIGSGSKGVLQIRVSGLSANTGYCFQTLTISNSTGEITLAPSVPVSVTTEKRISRLGVNGDDNVVFTNDLVRVPPVYIPNPADTDNGILVTLSVLGGKGKGPVTVPLGGQPAGYLNLNNLFAAQTSENLNLTGGERALLTEFHGNPRCVIDRFFKVLPDREKTRTRDLGLCFIEQDLDCNDVVDILDILRAVRWFGTKAGDACYWQRMDLNADAKVDILDVLNVAGSFGARP